MVAREFFNWTYREVVAVLRKHGFRESHTDSSHVIYVKIESTKQFLVCVPYHGSAAIKPRTMKSIIEDSGIPKVKWFN